MLLVLRDAIKLKTKTALYHEGGNARGSAQQKLLKELSTMRRAIEESIIKRSAITESNAGEMVGLNYQNQQDLQKIEQYLPLLVHLVEHVESHSKSSKVHSWVSDLKIQWSSAMTAACFIKIGGPKFFRVDSLRFELGMILFFYGAVLRERAFEILLTDLVESATLFRKAAGVYNHLSEKVLPTLKYSLPKESPVEATPSLSSIMSLICLADAQAVTIKRAEEKNNSPILLSKLHYGITQILEEATPILSAKPGELNSLSARTKEVISACKVLHELRSQRYLAEDLRGKEKIGIAISVLRNAMANANKANTPKNEPCISVFSKEITDAAEMLRKFEHENDFVWHDKIPSVNVLPSLQGKSIVSAIPYESQKWEGEALSLIGDPVKTQQNPREKVQ